MAGAVADPQAPVAKVIARSCRHFFSCVTMVWGVAKGSSIWWVAKFKGDRIVFFLQEISGREVTRWLVNIPVFHGTLWPMDFWTPCVSWLKTKIMGRFCRDIFHIAEVWHSSLWYAGHLQLLTRIPAQDLKTSFWDSVARTLSRELCRLSRDRVHLWVEGRPLSDFGVGQNTTPQDQKAALFLRKRNSTFRHGAQPLVSSY